MLIFNYCAFIQTWPLHFAKQLSSFKIVANFHLIDITYIFNKSITFLNNVSESIEYETIVLGSMPKMKQNEKGIK